MTGRPPAPSPRSRRLRIWLAYWVVLFAATHVPVRGAPHLMARQGDKVVHFLAFLALTLLGARYWRTLDPRTPASSPIIWGAVFIVYGALDEWLQQFVGRETSMADWIADTAGVIAGTLLVLWRFPAAAGSERPLDEPGRV